MVHILRGNEIEVKPVEWLWKPMIPFGDVTIVQGDGGDGKTTMMLKIAAMLSRGEVPPSLEDGCLIEQSNIEPLSTFFLTSENKAGSVAVPKFENEGGDMVVEVKGDDRDNSDSKQKLELGKIWESKAGSDSFGYFMVFDSNPLDNALSLDDFMARIKEL